MVETGGGCASPYLVPLYVADERKERTVVSAASIQIPASRAVQVLKCLAGGRLCSWLLLQAAMQKEGQTSVDTKRGGEKTSVKSYLWKLQCLDVGEHRVL